MEMSNGITPSNHMYKWNSGMAIKRFVMTLDDLKEVFPVELFNDKGAIEIENNRYSGTEFNFTLDGVSYQASPRT